MLSLRYYPIPYKLEQASRWYGTLFQLIWNRCPAYKKHGNQPINTLQTTMS